MDGRCWEPEMNAARMRQGKRRCNYGCKIEGQRLGQIRFPRLTLLRSGVRLWMILRLRETSVEWARCLCNRSRKGSHVRWQMGKREGYKELRGILKALHSYETIGLRRLRSEKCRWGTPVIKLITSSVKEQFFTDFATKWQSFDVAGR